MPSPERIHEFRRDVRAFATSSRARPLARSTRRDVVPRALARARRVPPPLAAVHFSSRARSPRPRARVRRPDRRARSPRASRSRAARPRRVHAPRASDILWRRPFASLSPSVDRTAPSRHSAARRAARDAARARGRPRLVRRDRSRRAPVPRRRGRPTRAREDLGAVQRRDGGRSGRRKVSRWCACITRR